ncbi:MAG: HAD-IIIA family hydrolase [Lachnospiraceae bacterium]|nr:HAD-IIIA family hydrolase [Lachnospiraceae bacterium]
MEDIQVVVMMGGIGSRLGKIVADCPKPLLPVGSRPFFEYELILLKAAGLRRFLFCTGYLSSEIEDYFGNGERFGVSIDYQRDSVDENGKAKLLGTGGALRHAYPKLEEDFMLVYADSFMDINYREVVYRYFEAKRNGAKSLMTLLRNNGQFDKSNVIYKDGLKLYDKKNATSDMDYIDYGVNMFSRNVLDGYSDGEKFDLSDIQHGLSLKDELFGLVVGKRFYEIGRPEPYKEFIEYAKQRFDVPTKAAFLDRDGVLNEIVYNEDTEQLDSPLNADELKLLPGAAEAVKKLKEAGYYIFIITNQPAAAKGKTDLGTLWDINKKLLELIPEIDDVFMCPHHPEGSSHCKEPVLIGKCDCRKPKAGLIDEACSCYKVDKGASFMAGDSFTDIMCGRAAGLKTVFVGNYKCDVCARLEYDKPDMIVNGISELAEVIGDMGSK